MSVTHRSFCLVRNRHCEKRSDVAIFDMLIADFSIEDCHAIARNDGWGLLS